MAVLTPKSGIGLIAESIDPFFNPQEKCMINGYVIRKLKEAKNDLKLREIYSENTELDRLRELPQLHGKLLLELLVKIIDGFKPLTTFTKTSILHF